VFGVGKTTKPAGTAGNTKLENSGASRKAKLKTSSKSAFSSLNLAKMVEIGQVSFKGEKMFSAHGWVGQGKLKIISPFLLTKIFSKERAPRSGASNDDTAKAERSEA